MGCSTGLTMEQKPLPVVESPQAKNRWVRYLAVALVSLTTMVSFLFYRQWGRELFRFTKAALEETVTLTTLDDWRTGSLGPGVALGLGVVAGVLADPAAAKDGFIYPLPPTPAPTEGEEVSRGGAESAFGSLPENPLSPTATAEPIAAQQAGSLTYQTRVLELKTDAVFLTQVSVQEYFSGDDSVSISYRTAQTAAELESALFQQLSFERHQNIQGSQALELSTAGGFRTEVGRLIQFEIRFAPGPDGAFDSPLPAVYELSFIYERKTAAAEEESAQIQLNLIYQAPNAPTNARLIVYGIEPEGLILEKDHLNLREEQGLVRLDNLALKPGSYKVEINASNYLPVQVVFVILEGVTSYTADIGAFSKLSGAGGGGPSADLNGDGFVNSLDFSLLLEQYGR